MSEIKTPLEKKAVSLKKDRRNIFGENSKATRKAIPRRKQLNHMGERRAVGQILSRLKDSAEEGDASEADALTRTTLVERKHKSFRKTPDSPLGVVLKKKLAKRDEYRTGRVDRTPFRSLNFNSVGVFDTPYDPTVHKREILRELRYCTVRPNWLAQKKKSRRYSKYACELATRWKDATLRNAPLLMGFFTEEPQWRERTLRWCEAALKVDSASR